MRKLEFILRRVATSLLVLVGVSIITFSLARVVPTNPAALYIGPKAQPAEIERVTIELGLDQPYPCNISATWAQSCRGIWATPSPPNARC